MMKHWLYERVLQVGNRRVMGLAVLAGLATAGARLEANAQSTTAEEGRLGARRDSATAMAAVVGLRAGRVSGRTLPGGVRAYFGVPFAAPPVGPLRWKPPQPVAPWNGVKRCVRFGPACPQPDASKYTFQTYASTSEDCLYLNVWTPAENGSDRLPVMVWIHGGAFVVGSGSDDLTNGQDLARKGVVVVTFNYRLGPFGFLAHPLLSKESKQDVSGNYGFLDQIAALEWVRDNIAAFGGDPKRVTIFGESGGGRSVAHLLVSPLAKGLFHRAILSSSSVYRPIQHLRESWYGRPSMEDVGLQVAKDLGCSDAPDPIAALRAKSAKQLLAGAKPGLAGMGKSSEDKSKERPFEPIVDGWAVPGDPSDLFDAGRQHAVPVIAGFNKDEGTIFAPRVIGQLKAKRLIKSMYPTYADEILKLYRIVRLSDGPKALSEISGDKNCGLPMRNLLRNMDKKGVKAWQYYFTRVRTDPILKKLGAYHGIEVRFAFNNLDRGRAKVDEIDRKLADVMSSYWVRFAETGDPNGPGLPEWPAFTRSTAKHLELGDRVQTGARLRETQLDLMEKIEKAERAGRRSR